MTAFIRQHPFKVFLAFLMLGVSVFDNIIIAETFKQLFYIAESKETDQLVPTLSKSNIVTIDVKITYLWYD
jgi:hypothetical protein